MANCLQLKDSCQASHGGQVGTALFTFEGETAYTASGMNINWNIIKPNKIISHRNQLRSILEAH